MNSHTVVVAEWLELGLAALSPLDLLTTECKTNQKVISIVFSIIDSSLSKCPEPKAVILI
jgi:hypothetical protein